ncbi:MAG: ATP-binding cassette domain-containing protein [Phycisphaerae bacterium]|nr:ATP-binding cassette domain-containing protein [Phycisphaerae bacterium]
MQSFKRIFKYVWPQWPRIILVVLSAIVVAVLLSVSFMTVIPLLKVMMSQESLHGWADRKISSTRYGVKFYLPDKMDFAESDIAFHLLVTDVDSNSPVEKAGISEMDQIIGVGNYLVGEEMAKNPSTKLFEQLATAEANQKLTIQYRHFDQEGMPSVNTTVLETGEKAFYLEMAQKLMEYLPRENTKENRTKGMVFIILLMLIATIIRCVAKFYQGYMAQKVVQIGVNHLREDAYKHVLDMPVGYFSTERPSDTVSRLINDTSVMGKAIKIMLGKALREPLNAAFMLGAALWLNWQLALIFLCGAPAILGLVGLFGRKMKKATKKSLMASSSMLAKLQEAMAGLKVVKVYNQQEHELGLFRNINNRLLKQLLKISKVDAATNPMMEILGMIAGSAALMVGAQWVTNQKMEAEEFLVLLVLLGSAAEAVRKTSDIWNKIQEANAASERVFSVMDSPVEYQSSDSAKIASFKNRIEFKDVWFTYPGSDAAVLKGVNLSVKAGQRVAIVGSNGSGKTTLINLLPRFYNLDKGSILIDGQDTKDMSLMSLRDQFGMVTQNVVTFNDTIAANIAYARPDASREDIIAAAKRSYAHEFIEPMPDGYDTVIGEYGSGLSGGQLQRIVIARAVLKDPAILIFDEATSQVDANSEAKIHKAIEEIMKDRTSFVIAHRFSTVVGADMIVVVDDGKIIAQGKHDDLMQSCSLYQSLYKTQLTAS